MVLRQKFSSFALSLGFHAFVLWLVMVAAPLYGFETNRLAVAGVAEIVVAVVIVACLFVEGLLATFISGLALAYAHAPLDLATSMLLGTAIGLSVMVLVLRPLAAESVHGWRLWRIPLTASFGLAITFLLWRSILPS